jgi:hypothetical protein
MDKKVNILPTGSPMITAYPRHANFLSILQRDILKLDWFFENYIQLQINKKDIENELKLEFHIGYDTLSIIKYCPAISYTLFQRDLIHKAYDDIIDFIIDYIDKGYYLYFLVNTAHISAYTNTYKSNHDLMVYGYDKDKKEIYAADFFDLKYSQESISFEELRKGYKDLLPFNMVEAYIERHKYIKTRYPELEAFCRKCIFVSLLNCIYRAYSERSFDLYKKELNDIIGIVKTYDVHKCGLSEQDEKILKALFINMKKYVSSIKKHYQIYKAI